MAYKNFLQYHASQKYVSELPVRVHTQNSNRNLESVCEAYKFKYPGWDFRAIEDAPSHWFNLMSNAGLKRALEEE